ncbi:FKBP-type peptidyl-prolyl cis-trans isomerase [Pedobacter hiemivivus]|uniref:peptidylprolyl isomerase n=1 Tax=Pedobacter hiemivivus TaxID=2530454 RepID=A0A4R0NG49_9SPHI|nr:aspartyl protease family protein [Pedobacter hiemivivus]TCC99500.1 hypothetical protein EZ444_02160 [Pedobacter hiemivivus]
MMKLIVLLAFFIVAGSADLPAQITKIPFESKGSHLYIKVQTAQSDSLSFIFDTGTTGATIDSATAEKIGVSKENRKMVNVGGIAGMQTNIMAVNQNLKLKNIEIKGLNLVLMNLNTLSKILGRRLDGLIGYEIMNKYVTQIDFDHKHLLLYNQIKEVDTTGYTGIPFEFNKGVLIPRFPITITLTNGERYTGRAMFDTGNAFSLLVSAPYNKFHNLNAKLGTVFPAWGLNPVAPDLVAMIKSMSFNGFDFGNMSIRLTTNEQAEPKDGYLGILGIEVIKRFNVILDYAHKRIYLKPNQSFNSNFTIEQQAVTTAPAPKLPSLVKESSKFLENNKTMPGVKQTASGLQYKILKKGMGAKPLPGDKVTLYYTVSLLDGTPLWKPFDAKNPWVHHLDKTLDGIKEAVLMMPAGSKWKLYIPPALAFGVDGYEEVPPGAGIICDLEVVGSVQ